jgi:hypothetical protein
MKTNFIFAIAALMFTQSVIGTPLPGSDDLVPEPVELVEPVEMKNETEVHKVELEHGQEQVEVHHGRFRVRLKFKDDHTNTTDTTHQTRTRNRGGRS